MLYMRLIIELTQLDRYLVQMQSQTKAAGVILPEVHGASKTITCKHAYRKTKTPDKAKNRSK